MNKLEEEIEYLLDRQEAISLPAQTNTIEFKTEICRKILKHLTKKDYVEVILHESKKPFDGSSAEGSILLEKYNINIIIEITTHSEDIEDRKYIIPCISVRAKYLGNEEKIKENGELLFSVGGALAKSIIVSNQFGYFEEFIRVKTVEFIYKLDGKCEEKLIVNTNPYKNIYI